jgi:hypothetical protein
MILDHDGAGSRTTAQFGAQAGIHCANMSSGMAIAAINMTLQAAF